jgi:glycosyltransferase involved in cell wall biosynthesis
MVAAADVGISFRKGELSKRAASPTKVGEYLAAGLPVVSSAGIGDCDELIERNRVGVIVRDASRDAHRIAAEAILALLRDDRLAERCLTVAQSDLSMRGVGGPRYAAVYERLLSP